MKNEVNDLIKGVLGFIKEGDLHRHLLNSSNLEDTRQSPYDFEKDFVLETGCWEVKLLKGLGEFKSKWRITFWSTNNLGRSRSYDYPEERFDNLGEVEIVRDALDGFFVGMEESFPELKKRWKPLLDAAAKPEPKVRKHRMLFNVFKPDKQMVEEQLMKEIVQAVLLTFKVEDTIHVKHEAGGGLPDISYDMTVVLAEYVEQ